MRPSHSLRLASDSARNPWLYLELRPSHSLRLASDSARNPWPDLLINLCATRATRLVILGRGSSVGLCTLEARLQVVLGLGSRARARAADRVEPRQHGALPQ
eukprot:3910261-Prymnesium_polylepis.1